MARSDLTLALALKASMKLEKAREKYETQMTEYLKHAALEYAQRFPKRKVQVCAGMGNISVWVSKGGYFKHPQKPVDYYDEYDFERTPFKKFAAPFLKVIEKMDEEHGKTYANFLSCSDVFLEYEGGKLVRERTQW